MRVNTAEHVNDKLIPETSLAIFEEMVEVLLKLGEYPGRFNQLRLHLRSDLVIKIEFLYDQVEIILKSIFYISSDLIV